MSMKNRIRRSFDNAAPDVLGRVLQDLPASKTAPAASPIPTPQKASQFREFVATAAAFALVVVVLGGGLWLYGTYGPLRPHDTEINFPTASTDPIEPPSSEPTEPPTNPTEPPTYPTVRPTYPTETERPTVSYWPTEEGVWYNPYPNDFWNLEFDRQYPHQINVSGDERIRFFIKGVDKYEYVRKAIAVYTADGKRVTRVGNGALYLLEEGGVAREVGTLSMAGYERVDARIGDGDYEIRIDIELVDIMVEYSHFTPILEADTWRYYDLKGATSIRLVLPNYDSVLSGAADVKCYVITEDGEIEITSTDSPYPPTSWPYDYPYP